MPQVRLTPRKASKRGSRDGRHVMSISFAQSQEGMRTKLKGFFGIRLEMNGFITSAHEAADTVNQCKMCMGTCSTKGMDTKYLPWIKIVGRNKARICMRKPP